MNTAEAEIHNILDKWLKASRELDINGIVAHYAPNIVAYDAVKQLQFVGLDAYREHWKACIDMCPGPMIFEIPELQMTTEDNSAFCFGLLRCGHRDDDGNEKCSWMRVTICWQKLQGQWRVVHEHFSAPFDMDSGKALFDLEP
jgi:ketosteroid isomerase-like protein